MYFYNNSDQIKNANDFCVNLKDMTDIGICKFQDHMTIYYIACKRFECIEVVKSISAESQKGSYSMFRPFNFYVPLILSHFCQKDNRSIFALLQNHVHIHKKNRKLRENLQLTISHKLQNKGKSTMNYLQPIDSASNVKIYFGITCRISFYVVFSIFYNFLYFYISVYIFLYFTIFLFFIFLYF